MWVFYVPVFCYSVLGGPPHRPVPVYAPTWQLCEAVRLATAPLAAPCRFEAEQ